MHLTEWLLFLSQVPATPSSIRVNIWRKLRAAGALGLQNGVWVLPAGEEQRQFLESLLAALIRQGASGQILLTSSLNERVEADILARFRSDRDEEYHEHLNKTLGDQIEEFAVDQNDGGPGSHDYSLEYTAFPLFEQRHCTMHGRQQQE